MLISIGNNSKSSPGKHKEAENIIHKSFEGSLELDTVAYNTFIKAMLVAGWYKAFQPFIEANIRLTHIMTHKFPFAGKLHFASSIYDRMLSLGISPSIQTYNTMIR